MRTLSAGGLAVAAVLSLSACGGGSDPASRPAPSPGDIRDLTGLAPPVETGQAQQARQQAIYAGSDSLVVSTTYAETVLLDETHSIRWLAECSGRACERLDPVTGQTITFELGANEVTLGDAEAIGSAHGITLTSETTRGERLDRNSFGAWMEHGVFTLEDDRATGEDYEASIVYTLAAGALAGRPPSGSATWLGIMVGTPVAGENRGNRLVGTAALNYDMAAGVLDAGFSGIKDIDRGTAHSVEAVIFSDLEVGPDGAFSRGQSGGRIQGGFYGPGHAEAGGIFEQSGIVGAFGAKRQ
ncbi:MAG: transferrin-binding protein-like solute binding protein [Boseongicola sp. SB0675_bin_26]|nr:transferrin-binding protein-like solute binding protein [Boseongicola sp. SB0675_bin_26]